MEPQKLPKTKRAHIGRVSFEIPAHMTLGGMAECWQADSQAFDALARLIVDGSPSFAWKIVHLWAEKHAYALTASGDDAASSEELHRRALLQERRRRQKRQP